MTQGEGDTHGLGNRGWSGELSSSMLNGTKLVGVVEVRRGGRRESCWQAQSRVKQAGPKFPIGPLPGAGGAWELGQAPSSFAPDQ